MPLRSPTKYGLTYDALKERIAVMKAFLMHPDRDFDSSARCRRIRRRTLRPGPRAATLLFAAMARGDAFLPRVA